MGHTAEEIGEAVGLTKAGIGQVCKDFPDLELVYKLPENEEVCSLLEDVLKANKSHVLLD